MSSPAETDDGQLLTFKRWFKADVRKANVWRKEAEEDFKFRDGHQWSDDDKQALEEQRRPVITFNRTGVLVDAVVGSEIGNRREVRYIPREMGDAKPNEILTSAAEWFRDQCDAEDEESDSFRDAVTAGMGWTETRLDVDENPRGEAKVDRIDPLEMVWDASAVKPNLVDSRRRWRVRKVDMAEALSLFPDATEEDINAAWADDSEEDESPNVIDKTNRYAREGDEHADDTKQVTIVHLEYLKDETYYKAIIVGPDGAPSAPVDLSEVKFKELTKAKLVLESVRLRKKTVYKTFLGRVILKDPQPTQTGTWTLNCITGLRDHDKGIFYGIVRRAKDPQRWANKWLSQMLHIMNSNAKGGVMMEEGAVEDIRDFERKWSRPDGITVVPDGAITSGKIMPKPVGQFPAGFDRLLQYADEAIQRATGINMELLGMRDANQPGVLEYQRKQSGLTILAPFFDSLKRYRKVQGRAMLALIQKYMMDGRLVRIVGEEKAEYVPLAGAENADIEYDIIVDDAPTSPNEKEKTWQIIQAMLPMLKDVIGPKEAVLLAEYSPLPASFVDKVKGMVAEAQAKAEPEQQKQAQMQEAAMMVELQNKQAEMQLNQAKVEVERAKLEFEQKKFADEQVMERERMAHESRTAATQADQKAAEAFMSGGGGGDPNVDPFARIVQALGQHVASATEQSAARNRAEMQAMMQAQADMLMRAVTSPKRVVRDPKTGRAVGVETILN